jgi:hypothetical protein
MGGPKCEGIFFRTAQLSSDHETKDLANWLVLTYVNPLLSCPLILVSVLRFVGRMQDSYFSFKGWREN